jgi:hypothetical protein
MQLESKMNGNTPPKLSHSAKALRSNKTSPSSKKPKRVPGKLKGKIWYSADAFSPEVDAELAADFYASRLFPPKRKPRR